MSGFEGDYFSDGDWDERSELTWNEFDWQQYLKSNEHEAARFLSLYQKFRDKPDRLDRIARMLGWDREDWAPSGDEAGEEADLVEALEDEGEAEDLEPYTVHKHPVFVVTHSLYQYVYTCWDQFTALNSRALNPSVVWRFGSSLHAGEMNAVMAVNALDLGDYSLTVCHLKNALGALNHSLRIIQELPTSNPRRLSRFQADMQAVFFDLRETWLRVMADCREEARRRRD